jgi:hypothetical protein
MCGAKGNRTLFHETHATQPRRFQPGPELLLGWSCLHRNESSFIAQEWSGKFDKGRQWRKRTSDHTSEGSGACTSQVLRPIRVNPDIDVESGGNTLEEVRLLPYRLDKHRRSSGQNGHYDARVTGP